MFDRKESSRLRSLADKNLLEKYLGSFFISCVLLDLSLWSFPKRFKQRELERADGKCAECAKTVGKENLILAHLLHGAQPDKRRRDNARAVCQFCETEHHLRRVRSACKINLSEEANARAVLQAMNLLNDEDQEILRVRYQAEWNLVCVLLEYVERRK